MVAGAAVPADLVAPAARHLARWSGAGTAPGGPGAPAVRRPAGRASGVPRTWWTGGCGRSRRSRRTRIRAPAAPALDLLGPVVVRVDPAVSRRPMRRAISPGFQLQQGLRLADFSLPTRLKDVYKGLAVNKTYDTIDGKQVVVLTGHPYPDVTEQLSFDRESGLLLRRSILTTGVRLMNLPEQIDYSDYRDVNGVKVPFTVRHATWNAVTTEKFTDVKLNAPMTDDVFAKPAPKS